MMKKTYEAVFLQTSPDKLEIKKGGGCIGCFGIPFFLAGIFMLLITMHIVPLSNANEVPWFGWVILFLMGLVFTAVGTGLVFGRNWITIDKTRQRIWTAWGLLQPMRGAEYNLESYKIVAIKYVAGDSDTPASYPVSLKAENGSKELAMCSFNNYGTSYGQAALISNFLHIPLEDYTTDHASMVKPDEPVTEEQLNLTEKTDEVSIPPEVMRCQVVESDGTLQIGIPGPAFSMFHLIVLVIPVVILFFFGFPLFSFFERTNTPRFVSMFFMGFIGLFFVLLPIIQVIKAFLLSKKITSVIKVNSQGIAIENTSSFWKRTLQITKAEIVGIDYGTRETAITTAMNNSTLNKDKEVKAGGLSAPYASLPVWITWLQKLSRAKGISVKSTQGIYSFGTGLPDEEVFHLYTLVRHYIGKAD